jgi:hypothetical protein
MIINIKIQNILNIIEIKKSMEPNKCIHQKQIMKIFIEVIPMIFQSSMGLRNKSVMVPCGTTQGNSYPIHNAHFFPHFT